MKEIRDAVEEANRIMRASCRVPLWHGSTTADVVDEILKSCGGQVICNGRLRNFVFTPITKNSFLFKTENWYEKVHGKN